MSEFTDFINSVMQQGFSHLIHRYYSIYRAVVVNNQDDMNLGRVQICCTTVGHTLQAFPTWWALPAMPGAGAGRGMFFPPEVGDTVFVNFREGDPSIPELYFGGWFGTSSGAGGTSSDVPTFLQPSAQPTKRGIVTKAGHALIFNDAVGQESVTLVYNGPAPTDPEQTTPFGSVTDATTVAAPATAAFNQGVSGSAFPGQQIGAVILNFDKNGVLLKTPSSFVFQIDESKGAMTWAMPNGSMISFAPTTGNIQIIHTSGSSIMMSSSAITISGTASQQVNISGQSVSLNGGALNLGGKAADFAVLGLKLIAWLAKHTHPYSFGTTLPPVPPPTPADFCSMTVKVQQ